MLFNRPKVSHPFGRSRESFASQSVNSHLPIRLPQFNASMDRAVSRAKAAKKPRAPRREGRKDVILSERQRGKNLALTPSSHVLGGRGDQTGRRPRAISWHGVRSATSGPFHRKVQAAAFPAPEGRPGCSHG